MLGAMLGIVLPMPARAQSTLDDVLNIFAEREKRLGGVRVEGAQRIQSSTIVAYLPVQVGDAYTQAALDASLRALFRTNLFADVSLRIEGDVLVVVVKENPIINSLTFRGATALTGIELAQVSGIAARAPYSEERASQAIERIRAAYRRAGYFAAVIAPDAEFIEGGRVNLAFLIQEGERARIRAVNFIGNTRFTDSQLKAAVATDETRWWKLLTATDFYDPDRFRFDSEALRSFYYDRGYADFEVTQAYAELAQDGAGFFLTFVLEEGDRYRFAEEEIVADVARVDPALLKGEVAHDKDNVYSRRLISLSLESIQNRLADLGLVFVEVSPEIERDEEARVIHVRYRLSEGPRVYVERIEIEGNGVTHENIIRREIEFVEGDALDRRLLARSLRNVRALGHFADVQVNQAPGSEPDRGIVRVDVQERPTGQLRLGIAYSSDDKLSVDAGITQNNFLGLGYQLAAEVSFGDEEDKYSLSFFNPSLRASRVGFSFRQSYEEDRETTFTQEEYDSVFGFTFPIAQDTSLRLYYEFEVDRIIDFTAAATDLVREVAAEGARAHSIVGYSWTRDRRNNTANPTSGWNFTLAQAYSGIGGGVKYLRSTIDGRVYYTLAEGWTTLLRLRGGYISGLGKNITSTDAFALGGLTFRGFDSDGVGPRCLSTYHRAKGYLVGTAQLGVPIRTLAEAGMSLHAFTDFGIAGESDAACAPDPDNYDAYAFRMTTGVSLRWASPIGPVQFDFNWPILAERYDLTEDFRFSIGASF